MSDEFRDIGNGQARNERTGGIVEVRHLRPGPREMGKRFLELTAEEWATLEKLAAKRTTESRTKHTPESCVRSFIAGAKRVLESKPWQHPSKTKAL